MDLAHKKASERFHAFHDSSNFHNLVIQYDRRSDKGGIVRAFQNERKWLLYRNRIGTLQISSNEEKGFRPYMLLVSSIVGCSSNLLRNILEKKRVPFEDLTIDTNVTRNEAEANRIEEIHLHFTVFGNELRESQIQKAIDVTRKNCSMVQSVKESIKIVETFEIKQS